jgi:uncharacterized protein
MYARIIKPLKKQSFFLFGPRGTGKSSWVRNAYPDADYIDLLDSDAFADLAASAKRLGRYRKPGRSQVIIDEVQKLPSLLEEVHRLIEMEKVQFILTGSSARKLRNAGANLLAGRALTRFLLPLTAKELGSDFDLVRSLTTGMLPAALAHEDPKSFLKSYVGTYLREEIFQEGLVRNIGGFARFLEAASFSQGSVLNLSRVAEDCATPRKTVEGYFQILEDLLIGFRLPSFQRRAKRRVIAHPKFYFFDVGVFRAIRPKGPLDSDEEINGAALETLIFQEIRALNEYLGWDYGLHYWRSSTNLEVDFVLYGERGLIGIEVKASSRVRAEDLKGLQAFGKDYPVARRIFLYGGEKRYAQDGIEVMPAGEFMKRAATVL